MATKKPKTDDLIAKPETILVLRTCAPDMSAYGGFVWPKAGPVECPDWDPAPHCGNGLHGFAKGEGDGGLASRDPTAVWLVVEVEASTIVPLGTEKVKFPRGVVLFAGAKHAAADLVAARHPEAAIIGRTATAGDSGTATAGARGTATAGDSGTATAGEMGTATAGDSGTATAGARGTATAGYAGTATAGEMGELRLRWYDGKRYRTAVFYVGEDGIEANVAYKLDVSNKPVRA